MSADLVFGDWRDDGVCRNADPEVFFPESGESLAPAKAVCADCIVRDECLEYALANGQLHGVWGGMSERQRRRLRQRRTREAMA